MSAAKCAALKAALSSASVMISSCTVKHNRVSGGFNRRHAGGQHVAADGLGDVLDQLAAVGGDARPFARYRMRAHVGQRAVLIDSGSGVVKHPPRRQTQTQPCTAVLHCDTAAGVRRFGVADGVCDCALQRLPKRGNGRKTLPKPSR